MTDAERLLWGHLRQRRLAGLRFRRQHAIGPFILDFYSPSAQVGIELDGDVHQSRRDQDRARDAWWSTRGIAVLRFGNEEIFVDVDDVLCRIGIAAAHRGA